MAPASGPEIMPAVARNTRRLCSGPSSNPAFVTRNARTMNTTHRTAKTIPCAFVRLLFMFLCGGHPHYGMIHSLAKLSVTPAFLNSARLLKRHQLARQPVQYRGQVMSQTQTERTRSTLLQAYLARLRISGFNSYRHPIGFCYLTTDHISNVSRHYQSVYRGPGSLLPSGRQPLPWQSSQSTRQSSHTPVPAQDGQSGCPSLAPG